MRGSAVRKLPRRAWLDLKGGEFLLNCSKRVVPKGQGLRYQGMGERGYEGVSMPPEVA